NPAVAEPESKNALSAAHSFGLKLDVLNASTERDFDGVFAQLVPLRTGGLVIGSDSFFTARHEQLAALAARHGVPEVYENREFLAAGGLISYGGRPTAASPGGGAFTWGAFQRQKAQAVPR